MPRLTLTLMPERLAVCRFGPDDPIPGWVFHAGANFWSVTRTPAELSIVCPEDDLPPSVERAETGWRAFELKGPIPFEQVGVLAGLTAPLAAAGIPVFVLSTFDTDYLLVKAERVEAVKAALADGFEVR